MAATAPSEAATAVGVPCANSVPKLTQNEPSQIPGQMRLPHSSTAATATPDGSHTGDATPGGMASCTPRRPAAKYTAATARIMIHLLAAADQRFCPIRKLSLWLPVGERE